MDETAVVRICTLIGRNLACRLNASLATGDIDKTLIDQLADKAF